MLAWRDSLGHGPVAAGYGTSLSAEHREAWRLHGDATTHGLAFVMLSGAKHPLSLPLLENASERGATGAR